jgi:hypothetical protein
VCPLSYSLEDAVAGSLAVLMYPLTSDNVIVYSRLSSVSEVWKNLETEVCKLVVGSRTRV